MTPATLLARLNRPETPRIVDVRTAEDHALDPRQIPGAIRMCHEQVTGLSGPTIVACQKGLKLSLGAAARLRAEGGDAWALEGGMIGWSTAGYPCIAAAALPRTGLFVAAEGAGARVLHWMTTRLLPPGHSLLAVPDEAVPDVALKFGAESVVSPQAFLERLGLVWPQLHRTLGMLERQGALLRAASPGEAMGLCDLAFRASASEDMLS